MRKFLLAFMFFSCLYLGSALAMDDIDAMQISIIDGEYKKAVTIGERILSSYKNKRPPKDVYVFLFIAYGELGKIRKASDIKAILMDEYGFQMEDFTHSSLFVDQGELFQIAAFKSRKNADKVIKRMEKGNFNCFIVVEDNFFKVRCKVSRGQKFLFDKQLKELGLYSRRVDN